MVPMQGSGGGGHTKEGGGTITIFCGACQGKHRPHTCGRTRGRKRRSPLEAMSNALSFSAPGHRTSLGFCELCLAKDRKIAMLERQLAQAEASRQACEQKVSSHRAPWLGYIIGEYWRMRRKYEEAVAAGILRADEGTEGATSEDDAVEASDEVCCLSPCFPFVNY